MPEIVKRVARAVLREGLLAGAFRSRSFRVLPTTGAEAAMLMCLWNRPSRMGPIISMLDRQTAPEGIVLYLWNNARRDHAQYLAAIEAAVPQLGSGALRRIELVRSPYNLGSIGRFYWARYLEKRRPGSPVIVIDDDQDLRDDFTEKALESYSPVAVTAWWAFRITGTYWEREHAQPGDRIDHVGPGGSVMSSSLFRDRRFFTGIPEQYRFLDDIWLTHIALSRGLRLAKLPVEIDFVMEETNQYHGQSDIKPRFYEALKALR